MNAEFNWWLLIVGLVVGAGLVWLVIADWSRREQDVSDEERSAESAWIAREMHQRGEHVDPEAAYEILAMHREYLRRTGDLDAPDETPGSDELAWPDEFSDPPESDDGASRPSGDSRTIGAPRTGDPTWTSDHNADPREVDGDSGVDWNVLRGPAEHRSVRSDASSPREWLATDPKSGPPPL